MVQLTYWLAEPPFWTIRIAYGSHMIISWKGKILSDPKWNEMNQVYIFKYGPTCPSMWPRETQALLA